MSNETEKLLAEYHANIELWKHDDTLRQQRQSNFLNVNAILFVGLGAAASLKPPWFHLGLAVLTLSAFGLLISLVWARVQKRNSEYVRFRRFQLRHIEERLGTVDTFTNTYQAFYEHEPVVFGGKVPSFSVSEDARAPSTRAEGRLPVVLSILWLSGCLAGLILAMFNYAG